MTPAPTPVVEPVTPVRAAAPLAAGGPNSHGHPGRSSNGAAALRTATAAASAAAAVPPGGELAPAPAGSAAVLKQFAAIDGVQWAVLADREGFLLDVAGKGVVDAEVAGALSACLTESSEGLGRELGRGALLGMILEYSQGMVVLYSVGASALLAIALGEPSALGKVRYFAKKSIPELLQTV
jgi:hypothetical protein